MSENVVGPLKVGGFTKDTLEKWKGEYGAPVGADQRGWMSLSPADRLALGVELCEVVDAVRADVKDAGIVRLRVTPGREGFVGLTGTARTELGNLVQFKETSGQQVGDMVTITRNGNVLEIREILSEVGTD